MKMKPIRTHGLAVYTALSIIDKGLFFVLPLIFLILYRSEDMYTKIEYIYAFVAILLPFADGGLRYYIFFSEKNCERDFKQICQMFSMVILLYTSMSIVFFLLSVTLLYWMILARLVFMLLSTYLVAYFRVLDRPSRAYYFSSGTMLIVLLSLVVLYLLNLQKFSLIFFHALLLLACIIWLTKEKLVLVSISQMLLLYRKILQFSWPIILNLLIISLIASYSKIYLYHYSSPNEMAKFSIAQRLSYVIILFHSVISGYYAKSLYNSPVRHIKKILLNYFMSMYSLGGICLLMSVIVIMKLGYSFNIFLMFILLICYSLFWSSTSVFELFYGRTNKTIYVLYVNVFSLIMFFLLIFMMQTWANKLLMFSLAMFLSMLSGFVLSIMIFRFKTLPVLKQEDLTD